MRRTSAAWSWCCQAFATSVTERCLRSITAEAVLELEAQGAVQAVLVAGDESNVQAPVAPFDGGGGNERREPAAMAEVGVAVERADHRPQLHAVQLEGH